MSTTLHLNMSEPAERQVLWESLRRMQGLWTFEMRQNRRLRSSAQNRLYWGCYVHAFRMYLMEQGQPYSQEAIHQMLAGKFLRETGFDPRTGEVIGDYTRSTSTLTTTEFNQYLDNIEGYLSEKFGIRIPTIQQFTGGVAA